MENTFISNLVTVLQESTVSLPATEVALLLAILTFTLLFRYPKVGLVAAYIFCYRWGWWVFASRENQLVFLLYLIFGCLVGGLVVLQMFISHHKSES